MADQWTERQLDAINARGTSVIVSAAAGSGKTSVLVEKLVRLMSDTENKTPADRIIVVTFTNDAAAQMKLRLSEALAKRLETEPENDWLLQQQSLVQSAKISTIHSFCFDLIRENVRDLGISAGFKIAQESESKIIISKAMDAVFEDYYKNKPELMEKLIGFTNENSRSDDKLEAMVLKMHEFILSIPFGDKWLDEKQDRFKKGFMPESDILAEKYIELICDKMEHIISQYEYIITCAAKIEDENGGTYAKDKNSAFYKTYCSLEEELSQLKNYKIRLKGKSLEWDMRVMPVIESDDKFSFGRYIYKSAKKPVTEKAAAEFERIKAIREECKELLNTIFKNIFTKETIESDYAVHSEITGGIIEIVKALEIETERIKSEKNELCFSDAETLAVKLLCEIGEGGKIVKTPLAKELSEYYKLIMIDEFQDVNNNQSLIFRMLSHGGEAEKNGDNLFTVGDLKQSIYLFRQSNPKIFSSMLENADNYSPDYSGKNAAVLLNKNFRSSIDVIEFVNYVFGMLMSKKTGGTDYTENEALVCGASYPEAERATEIIVVNDIETDDKKPMDENADEDDETELDVNAEAYEVTQKIKTLLETAEVKSADGVRKCEYRDLCILIRDRERGRLYADALSANGIPAFCEMTSGYLQSREISVLINLLRTIDNPMRDIPIVSVLMSPIFMLTADEMAELRGINQDRIFNCCITALEENSGITDALRAKLKRFKEVFEKLRLCSASQSLDRLIRTIYDSTDFISAVQVFDDGSRKRANLRLLLEYATGYEENSDGGLSGFLRYIDNISASGGDFKVASTVSASENAVSIKTIHSSKGLEYPYVFLCGTSKRFNLVDCSDRFQINSELGFGIRIINRQSLKSYKSFPQFVISSINKQELVSEEMRLLYVALTRAKERLFITILRNKRMDAKHQSIVSAVSAAGKIDDYLVSSADNMQSWLFAAMLVHPDAAALRKAYNADKIKISGKSENVRINISEKEISGKQAIVNNAAVQAKPDDRTVELITAKLRQKYDERLSKLTAKITATELSRESGGEITLTRPDFTIGMHGLTAAEKGSAMHTFMQNAIYSFAEKSVAAEADRLTESGVITKYEREALQLDKLEKFFKSEIYARMKESREIMREKNFLVEISALDLDDELKTEYNSTNGMLQGIADCIFRENDGYVLVDYKTDRTSSADELRERYRRQLMLYKAAFSVILRERIKGTYLYSFALGKEILLNI